MTTRLDGLTVTAAQYVVAAGQALDAGRVDQASHYLASVTATFPDHPEVLRMLAG